MSNGRLFVLIGATPESLATAMLSRGRKHARSGDDVVVAVPAGSEGLPGPESSLPMLQDATPGRVDLAALLRRRPDVALVADPASFDSFDLGGSTPERVLTVVLEAGIDVVITVAVNQIESLLDVAATISGQQPGGVLPDRFLRSATEIEVVDSPGDGDPSSSGLRELALRWVADALALDSDAIEGDIRERVMVAFTAAPGGDELIRRAARIAQRSRARLIGAHVEPSVDARINTAELSLRRRLIEDVGGVCREVHGADVAEALVEAARSEGVTQLVLGGSRRGRGERLRHGSVVSRVLRLAPELDMHIISTQEEPGSVARDNRQAGLHPTPLSPQRRRSAWMLLVLGFPILNGLLVLAGSHTDLPVDLLANLLLSVAVAALGGLLPALVASVAAFLLVNLLFVDPTGTLKVADPGQFVALGTFLAVSLGVAALVDRLARRNAELEQAVTRSTALARSSAELVGGASPLPGLVERLRATFGYEAASLLVRGPGGWVVETSSGPGPAPVRPGGGWPLTLSVDDSSVLVVRGGEPSGADRAVLRAFTDQLVLAMERARLEDVAAQASVLAEADALRRGLLLAVSHDLRTPLAGMKAAVTSLLAPDVVFSEVETREFLQLIDAEVDRLDRVIGNLLDAGRLESGTLPVDLRPTHLDEVVAAALHSIDVPSGQIALGVPESLPPVVSDAALLERGVANVVANALVVEPAGACVRVEAAVVDREVQLRVIDHGPGVLADERSLVVQSFQRLGDRSSQAGVGLGLAIADGFTTAIGGRLELADTAGGGLTVVFHLPLPPSGKSPALLESEA